MPMIRIETKPGEPVLSGDTQITPLARVATLRLSFPGGGFGFVWNRPSAVKVQRADGQEETLPIQDVTRMAQMALLGIGLLCGLLILLFTKKRK